MKRMAFEMPEMKITAFMEENIVTQSGINGTKLEVEPTDGYVTAEKNFKDFQKAIEFTW